MLMHLATTPLKRYFILIKKFIYKSASNTFVPLMGFGLGWSTFLLLSQDDFLVWGVSHCLQQSQLKVSLYFQSLLPMGFHEKCYSNLLLKDWISSISKDDAQKNKQNHLSFDNILAQCGIREQILYLEEHATEGIPYFCIADVFHSWSNIHKHAFLEKESLIEDSNKLNKQKDPDRLALTGDIKAYESHQLCEALWKKVQEGVIPFDVGIRALCILAVRNKSNARWMVQKSLLVDFLKSYEIYQHHLKDDGGTGAGELIPPYEVTAAMIALVKVFHDANIRFPWIPLPGTLTGEVYPLAHYVNSEQWHSLFYSINDKRTLLYATEPVLAFLGVMCKKLKCSEIIAWKQ